MLFHLRTFGQFHHQWLVVLLLFSAPSQCCSIPAPAASSLECVLRRTSCETHREQAKYRWAPTESSAFGIMSSSALRRRGTLTGSGKKRTLSGKRIRKRSHIAAAPVGVVPHPQRYPMWVMPVSYFLDRERTCEFECHQDLLKKEGALVRATPDMAERIIFISHQWTSFTEPDPTNEQFLALRQILERLMAGKVKKVGTRAMHQRLSKKTGVSSASMTAAVWREILPDSFLWLDYMSVPQPGAEILKRHAKKDDRTAGMMSRRNTSINVNVSPQSKSPISGTAGKGAQVREPSLKAIFHREMAGREEAKGNDEKDAEQEAILQRLAGDLRNAVESIPFYVSCSSMVLVLAPTVRHSDLHGVICGYDTWRKRGWCTLELMTASVSAREVPVMIVKGAHARPRFLAPEEAWRLFCGLSEFTCCQINHQRADGRKMACDKIVVRRVLATVIDHASDMLASAGRMTESRALICRRPGWLQLLPRDGSAPRGSLSLPEFELDPLKSFRERLKWDPDAEAAGFFNGYTLLFYCVLNNNRDALRDLISELDRNGSLANVVNLAVTKTYTHTQIFVGATPLYYAMGMADFSIVEMLISAGADPHYRWSGTWTALDGGLMYDPGDTNTIRWLKKFPQWSLDGARTDSGRSLPSLSLAVVASSSNYPENKVAALLAAKSNTHFKSMGMKVSVLTAACSNDSPSARLIEMILKAKNGPDVNFQTHAVSRKGKTILRAVRFLHRLRIRPRWVKTMLRHQGSTALHMAASKGSGTAVRALIEAGADPTLLNGLGQTAIDVCKQSFGKAPPTLVEVIEDYGGASQDAQSPSAANLLNVATRTAANTAYTP